MIARLNKRPLAPLLALSVLALSSNGLAQSLLPLDSRPATRLLPAQLASLHSEAWQVVPAQWLGRAATPADHAQLLAWLEQQRSRSGPLVVALDALAYGGLVQSRTSPLSTQEALQRLAPLQDWTAQTGQAVYAFITLPREPDATNRARNLEVVREMLNWAALGRFAELHIAWDDALRGSPAPAEGAALAREVAERGLTRVKVYPGADEVASMLVARALAPAEASVYFEYSDPKKALNIIQYEGIPLTQSAINHAQASGFVVAEQPQDAQLLVYVFNGGSSRQAALRVSQLLNQNKKVAVVDVEKVNLGNLNFWKDLRTLRQQARLVSLAAWGTPGNNLGTALAHSKLVLAGVSPVRQDALMARLYANDLIYSSVVRAQLRKEVKEADMNTPEASAELLKLAQHFAPFRMGLTYNITGAQLPWGRSFEWDFELEPVLPPEPINPKPTDPKPTE